jgi:hypothetical protein
MRTVVVSKYMYIKNTQWEREATSTQQTSMQCILMPIWVIQSDQYHNSKQIEYHQSTHLAWYASSFELTQWSLCTDEQWIRYYVQHVEPVYDFGWDIDHMTAFLTTKQ